MLQGGRLQALGQAGGGFSFIRECPDCDRPMQIAEDSHVTFHYQLSDADGQVIDSSAERDPLSYIHGHGQIVGGLEKALAEHAAGDHVDVVVPSAEGYGDYQEALLVRIPTTAFPEEMIEQLQPGVQFQGPHPADPNQGALYRVMAREEEEVVADANHILAGVDLHFSVDIVSVRAASEAEIEALSCDNPDHNHG